MGVATATESDWTTGLPVGECEDELKEESCKEVICESVACDFEQEVSGGGRQGETNEGLTAVVAEVVADVFATISAVCLAG